MNGFDEDEDDTKVGTGALATGDDDEPTTSTKFTLFTRDAPESNVPVKSTVPIESNSGLEHGQVSIATVKAKPDQQPAATEYEDPTGDDELLADTPKVAAKPAPAPPPAPVKKLVSAMKKPAEKDMDVVGMPAKAKPATEVPLPKAKAAAAAAPVSAPKTPERAPESETMDIDISALSSPVTAASGKARTPLKNTVSPRLGPKTPEAMPSPQLKPLTPEIAATPPRKPTVSHTLPVETKATGKAASPTKAKATPEPPVAAAVAATAEKAPSPARKLVFTDALLTEPAPKIVTSAPPKTPEPAPAPAVSATAVESDEFGPKTRPTGMPISEWRKISIARTSAAQNAKSAVVTAAPVKPARVEAEAEKPVEKKETAPAPLQLKPARTPIPTPVAAADGAKKRKTDEPEATAEESKKDESAATAGPRKKLKTAEEPKAEIKAHTKSNGKAKETVAAAKMDVDTDSKAEHKKASNGVVAKVVEEPAKKPTEPVAATVDTEPKPPKKADETAAATTLTAIKSAKKPAAAAKPMTDDPDGTDSEKDTKAPAKKAKKVSDLHPAAQQMLAVADPPAAASTEPTETKSKAAAKKKASAKHAISEHGQVDISPLVSLGDCFNRVAVFMRHSCPDAFEEVSNSARLVFPSEILAKFVGGMTPAHIRMFMQVLQYTRPDAWKEVQKLDAPALERKQMASIAAVSNEANETSVEKSVSKKKSKKA